MGRSFRLAATMGLLAMTMAACTGGGPAGSAPTSSGPTATSSAAPPAATESPSGTPSGAVERDVEGEGTPLDAGVYTWSGFEPHVTFELPDGWEGGHTHDDFFDVWNGAFVAFMRPTSIVSGKGERVQARGLDPLATIEAIGGRKGVDASEPFQTAVGGAAGVGLDATAKEDVPLFGLEGEENDVPLPAGWRLRYRAVEIEGVTVLVVVGAPKPVDEAAVREAEAVVHTVEWASTARPVPIEGGGASLDSAAYTNPDFAPGVSFDVDEGWTGGHLIDEFFDVQREGLLVGFADPTFFVRPDGGTTKVAALDTPGAVALLAKTLGGKATEVERCDYFEGLRARCLDAEPEDDVDVFGGPEGRLTLQGGSWNRMAVLELDGEVELAVVLMNDGFDRELLTQAEDVLRTARWG